MSVPAVAGPAKTILVVDDDRSVGETFERLLRLEGYNVATAAGSEMGLRLAEQLRPDAVILDLRMPVIDGLQFLRTMRRNKSLLDVPVAIVTGDYFLGDDTTTELRSLGAAVRFKPLWCEDLVALARSLLNV